MSDLLQRLIDRTKAPLSAVQPILPSIYAPADRTENDSGAMIRTEITESATRSDPFPPRQTDERESGNESAPMSGHPVETRASPAAPAPPQQTARPAPPGNDASVTPPNFEKNFSSPMAPPPVKAKLSAAEKARDKGTLIKTFVPQSFGSKMAKSGAKREDAGSIPGPGKSGLKPNVPLHQDVGRQAPGINPDPQSAQTKPPGSKAIPPTGPDVATKTDRNKTMPSLTATLKWIEGKAPPVIGHDASEKKTETSQSHGSGSFNESSLGKTSVPPDSEAASQRENKSARILKPMDTESFPTRQSENSASKVSRSNDRVAPVEVSVSIGHIEVKSAQPTPPAPRRTPPRPRVTLNEFLKSPYSGGPR
jgi:hypothetical protein